MKFLISRAQGPDVSGLGAGAAATGATGAGAGAGGAAGWELPPPLIMLVMALPATEPKATPPAVVAICKEEWNHIKYGKFS